MTKNFFVSTFQFQTWVNKSESGTFCGWKEVEILRLETY